MRQYNLAAMEAVCKTETLETSVVRVYPGAPNKEERRKNKNEIEAI